MLKRLLYIAVMLGFPITPVQGQIDSANVWVSTALAGGPHTIQTIVVDPERSDTVYTGTVPGSIYQSLNRSLTWTQMPAALGTIAEGVFSITFNPLNANVVYAGGDMSGLFRSTDRGASWTQTSLAIPPLVTFGTNKIVIDASDTSRIYAGTSAGLWISDDDGGTWMTTTAIDTINGISIGALVVIPQTPDTVLAASTGSAGVFRSLDRAGSWAPANNGLTDTDVTGMVVSPAVTGLIVVSTDGGGVFRSTDSGGSWTAANTGIGNLGLASVAISPSNPTVLYAGSLTGEIYESTDSGVNWNNITFALANANPVNAIAVHPDSAHITYIGIDNVYRLRQSGLDSISFLTTNTQISVIHAADFNADGEADLVIGNAGTQTVTVLMNGSAGATLIQRVLSTGSEPTSIATADLDGDGDLDLAIGHRTQQTAAVLFNDGTGVFSAPTELFVGGAVTHLALGDFDTDGDVDLAATDDGSTVFIYKNDGVGSFGAPQTASGLTSPTGLRVGDFTGDGIDDLLLSGTGNRVRLLRNHGNATFTSLTDVDFSSTPQALTTGDYDIDGDLDFSVSLDDASVVVYANRGDGTFGDSLVYARADTMTSLRSVDLDQDGYLDLFVPSGNGSIDVLVNDANGRFDSVRVVGSQTGIGAGLASDLTGNGVPDFALGQPPDSRLVMFSNPFAKDIKGPAPPRDLAAVDTQGDLGGRVTLTWHRPNVDETTGRIARYRVYRATAEAGPYTLFTTLDTTATNERDSTFVNRTFVDTAATVGTGFYYYLQSENGGGTLSASSDTVTSTSQAQSFFDFQFEGNSPFHIQDTVAVTVRLNPVGADLSSLSLFIDYDTRAFLMVDGDTTEAGIQPFAVDSTLATQSSILQNKVDTSSTSGTGKADLGIVFLPTLPDEPVPVGTLRVVALRDTSTRIRVVNDTSTVRQSAFTTTDGAFVLPFIAPASTIILRNHKVRGTVSFQGRTESLDIAARFDLTQNDSPGTGTALPDSVAYQPPNDADQTSTGVQLTLNEDGSFTLLQIPGGTYGLFAKTFHYLRGRIATDSLLVNDSTGVAGSTTFSWVGIDTTFTTSDLRAGDANDDNQVDIADFGVLGANFGASGFVEGSPAWSADFNGDGVVNLADFALLQSNFGEVGMGPSVATKPAVSAARIAWIAPDDLPGQGQVWAREIPPSVGYAFDLVGDGGAGERVFAALTAGSWFNPSMALTLRRQLQRGDETILRLAAVLRDPAASFSGDGILFSADDMPFDLRVERVRFLTADGLVIIGQGDVPLGDGFFPVAETILRQNVPNPFNPETVIPFELADVGLVRLTVYSTLGQEVRTLVDEVRSAGRHRVRWDGRDERGRRVGSGLFLYRLTVNGLDGSSRYHAVRKAILLK